MRLCCLQCWLSLSNTDVAYFDQRLGAAHFKGWSKYAFSHFCMKNVKTGKRMKNEVIKPVHWSCNQTLVEGYIESLFTKYSPRLTPFASGMKFAAHNFTRSICRTLRYFVTCYVIDIYVTDSPYETHISPLLN